MDTRQALLVDAFAAEPTTGTPTGVVPEADGLTDDQMQAVASELGATETAFVLPAEDADRRLRCFSPTKELAQAETAAVAAHAALYERGEIDDSEWTVATARGDVAVETKQNGMVWVEQGRADITEVDIPYSDVADALGLNAATLKDVGADLPLVTAGVGESWLMVPVNYFEHLSGLTMDVAAVDSLCDRVDAAGVYPFTFDTVGADATRRSTFHGRAFRVGSRAEEPVTATASGACAAFVRRYGALDDTIEQIIAEGGHFRDRPGTVSVDTDGTEVWVGGRAVTALDGTVTVPAVDDDDIIEA
ncbi:diaminopimelate epimerase [Haloarcula marismortui ATCC 43049]|jgi:PhzF family phenazine biosynthesis protein|uniref:Diaminopimelate epimerase n=1 Tax=Haloarcula marismortui (strain ATCC 43049 / DSM 3752 / JCM 8966 / VKM B-1809) TaxID=272569 RepID=Q5V1B7_HALMA|nr:PhzF family phenazine biosynthesis protein [Haloarcula marismortui]AAV46686.1 diaminopimelate epimerase [Haloarcula marismortui ATCC 43049]QCP91397.1 PhzF family phenazine biosynthesis protein [Haloarcula marismortui ATCC 43049]